MSYELPFGSLAHNLKLKTHNLKLITPKDYVRILYPPTSN